MLEITPIVLSLIALLFTAISFIKSDKKDARAEDKDTSARFEDIREGLLKANIKLDQVCATTNETRSDIKSLNKDLGELDKRISVVEENLKTAFIRIDELRKVVK